MLFSVIRHFILGHFSVVVCDTENTLHPNLFDIGFIEVSLEHFLSRFVLVTAHILTFIGSDELLLNSHRF